MMLACIYLEVRDSLFYKTPHFKWREKKINQASSKYTSSVVALLYTLKLLSAVTFAYIFIKYYVKHCSV